MGEERNILAIESAVGGGSIALIRNDGVTIVRDDDNHASRAEKIISVIAGVLAEADLAPRDLRRIAVSTGPGSYSGIRIGIATALGLSHAIGVPVVGVPILQAMSRNCPSSGSLVVAIPVGKNDVAWQRFGAAEDGIRVALNGPEVLSLLSFFRAVEKIDEAAIFVHGDLLLRIAGNIPGRPHTLIDAGTGLATFVAKFALHDDTSESSSSLRPLYLRNKDNVPRPGAF